MAHRHYKHDWPQRAYKHGGFSAVWREADHRGGWRPWRVAFLWAKGRADRLPDGSKFRHAAHVYEREYKKRRRRHHSHLWPKHGVIEELYINDNGLENHVHVASCDRNFLIALAKVAIRHYGAAGYVREFPPFDSVDCVHTSGSWHYRESGQCGTPRNCDNRGDGLAFDLGCPRREEFARDLKQRYPVRESDF